MLLDKNFAENLQISYYYIQIAVLKLVNVYFNKTLGVNIEETFLNIGTNALGGVYCNWIVSIGIISKKEYVLKYIDIVKVIQVDGDLWRSSGTTPFEGTFGVRGIFELQSHSASPGIWQ